jgi:parvulin-like peptidyl-prolyl isomerase
VVSVVEAQFGYHVIKLEERHPTEADKTQEEVRPATFHQAHRLAYVD